MFWSKVNPNSGVGDTPFYGLDISPNNGALFTPILTERNKPRPLLIVGSNSLNIILNIIK